MFVFTKAGLIPLQHATLRLAEVTVKGHSGMERMVKAIWEEWMQDTFKVHVSLIVLLVVFLQSLKVFIVVALLLKIPESHPK